MDTDLTSSTPTFPQATRFSMCALNGKSVEILLVEDNPADVRLTREIFEDEASRRTSTSSATASRRWPSCAGRASTQDSPARSSSCSTSTFPKKDGREVLEELKADTDLCRIPVVVLTTSAAESDISRSYELHANCFITKPLDLDEFFDVVALDQGLLARERPPALCIDDGPDDQQAERLPDPAGRGQPRRRSPRPGDAQRRGRRAPTSTSSHVERLAEAREELMQNGGPSACCSTCRCRTHGGSRR